MSQSVITTAFEELKAQQAANGGILVLDEFVFANVPNLNISDPINREESWPTASQIVYRQSVTKTGMVNSNAVVYSVVLGADVGDFEFNWIGLISKASNSVCMIVHAPVQKKLKTASGQQGNVLTRSFLMEFDGASSQTQIITPADTWQIDFTARLSGIDERVKQENVDLWGDAVFFGESYFVSRKENQYSVKSGVGYVSGLRSELLSDQLLDVPSVGSRVWVDVSWKGTLSSVWKTQVKLTVAQDLANYSIGDEKHFVYPVASIDGAGKVTDLRNTNQNGIMHELDKKQPLDSTLTALASLVGSKDKVPFFTGNDQFDLASLTSVGRELIGCKTLEALFAYMGIFDAAKRSVGTEQDQIPDMNSFVFLNSNQGYMTFPTPGAKSVSEMLKLQWGTASGTGSLYRGNYPLAFSKLVFQAVPAMADKSAGVLSGLTPYVNATTFTNLAQLTVNVAGTDNQGIASCRYLAVGI